MGWAHGAMGGSAEPLMTKALDAFRACNRATR